MIIVGENINASISGVKAVIESRESDRLIDMANAQVDSGADYIDVNVGTGQGSQQDEITNMIWAVQTLAEKTDRPLCIDSSDPAVIEAGLSALSGARGMINSTKAEDSLLDAIMPLTLKHDASLVALAMDETGIPDTVEARVNACEKIARSAHQHGVPNTSIYFDPLVLPVSTDGKHGIITLKTIKAIKETFPDANTIVGLSNISYGLPGRAAINAAFLHMAIYAGLDAMIVNPQEKSIIDAVLVGEALIGRDRHFRRYSRMFRRK